ncbi:probable bifunctional methylenetetrahydrofolate dehydrogenase/cyclohydrolase 2 isoform X2 [Vulpes lagopus]|uniref:probable bifunctional methylenetetrahydrofolate dehydrogenase/cyclohydrolase 2 isoform X2 n=1 Tax=Vulpes lagopus TaxID=494514 RepID=UPI001BCA116A|nr:probable bifunctional methylenetetrahydrofolate dehydrogenase/cyclohydrolase 2 isoform X2 [Vulpes lagopus]
MAVPARGVSLVGGRLSRAPALGGGPALPLGASRGLRSSGVRRDAIIISGTEMAKQIQKEIQRGVESWISLGNRRPHLSIILVGDNPASHTYVRKKIRAASAVGICSEIILKPKDVSQEELLDITDQLNMDPRVSGILVQLPLPDHVDERTVCNGIAPEKDVDGFHIINIGRLCLDQHSLIPATASAVWEIIKRTGIETFGKNVVVAGRSKNVGMPIAMLLHTDGEHERPGGDATVTIAHRYTPKEQLKIHTQLADVIIVAAVLRPSSTTDGDWGAGVGDDIHSAFGAFWADPVTWPAPAAFLSTALMTSAQTVTNSRTARRRTVREALDTRRFARNHISNGSSPRFQDLGPSSSFFPE